VNTGAKLNAEHVEGTAEMVAGEKAEQPHMQGVHAFPLGFFAEPRGGFCRLHYSRRVQVDASPFRWFSKLVHPVVDVAAQRAAGLAAPRHVSAPRGDPCLLCIY